MDRWLFLIALVWLTSSCGGGGEGKAANTSSLHSVSSSSSSSSSSLAATGIEWTQAEWEILASLAPAQFPSPPPDPSNHYADNPDAVLLGEIFFNDPGFSGPLLDIDNDGGPNSLGRKGDTGKVACAGCHIEASGFSDTRSTFQQISLGAGWTSRRTPSLLNVGYLPLISWGGRHSTLYSQVFAPIENPLEMNSSRLYVATYIADYYSELYSQVFGEDSLLPLYDKETFVRLPPEKAGCQLVVDVSHPRQLPPADIYECHGMPGDGAEFDALNQIEQEVVNRVVVNFGKAIAAYERTLQCGPGRFDAYVNGDSQALTEQEQWGAQLFIGKAQCVSCHSGPLLTDKDFHNIGVVQGVTREGIINNNDVGAALDLPLAKTDPLGLFGPFSDGVDDRFDRIDEQGLEGAFKTPSLRCVAQRPSFMHTGLMGTLDEVVDFFNRGGDALGYPGENVLTPLNLSREEQRALIAFLRALTPSSGP